jgi:NADH-quinone oxidoreductase subunit C
VSDQTPAGLDATATDDNATDAPVPADTLEPGEVVAERAGLFGASGSGDTSGYGGLQQQVVFPAESARPYGGYFDAIADALAAALDAAGMTWGDVVEKVVIDRGDMTLHIRREHLLTVSQILRDNPDLRFEMCMGVSGVHFPESKGRELHGHYPLLSYTHNRRVNLDVAAPDADPHLPSVVSVWPTNDWHERETYDFFGIIFDGHPALTRIEMPDDWVGHPQRKDYPLGGIPVEYKGATIPPPDQRRGYA